MKRWWATWWAGTKDHLFWVTAGWLFVLLVFSLIGLVIGIAGYLLK